MRSNVCVITKDIAFNRLSIVCASEWCSKEDRVSLVPIKGILSRDEGIDLVYTDSGSSPFQFRSGQRGMSLKVNRTPARFERTFNA